MKTKIIITGGSGFIGREIIAQLLKKNYEVVVIDNLSHSIPLVPQTNLSFLNIDLRKDDQRLQEVFKGATYCLHLAAQVGGIKLTGSYSSAVVLNNLQIDINVLKSAIQAKIKKIIYTSSALVYEQVKKFPLKEIEASNLPSPMGSYAFSKWTGERLFKFVEADQKMDFSIIRLANVYGINQNILKNDFALHVIPDLIIKVLKDQTPLRLYGDGKQKRSFVHVKDAARAIIACMESTKSKNEIFNVSSDKETEILELAQKIWTLCGRNNKLSFKNEKAAQFDLRRSFCETRKIKKTLNWNTEITLDDGLKELIDWFKKNYDFKKS